MGSSSRAGLGENAKPADQDAASARQTNDAAVPMKGVALWALREFVDKHRDRLEQGACICSSIAAILPRLPLQFSGLQSSISRVCATTPAPVFNRCELEGFFACS